MDSGPTPYSDFRPTHHFCSGVLLTTVYVRNCKLIDSKKRFVVFERGTVQRGDVVQRLVVYKSRRVNLFSASISGSERQCFQMPLRENDLHGLIKGVQCRRVMCRKDVFSPTVTVVTGDATIVLTAIENDYEQSMRQHDLWYDCLKKKLNFGGYWNVEQEATSGSSSTVILCLSKYRLSVLSVRPDDDNVFDVQAKYNTGNIVCWRLHFGDSQRQVAYVSVTIASQDDSANFDRLRFRIDHNETVASDISEVLNGTPLPRLQCAVHHQTTSSRCPHSHRCPSDPYNAAQHTPSGRRRTHHAPVDKRLSRDDMELVLQRRPPNPPPRLPPRTQPHQHVLNSYDLNALSRTVSVKDAVLFYENISSVNGQRPRRPPDVVASHLDEYEEYWSIVFTLHEVLQKKKPEPDTLGLSNVKRMRLCLMLLDDSIPSWKNLAECIGLTQEAVKMIETIFRLSVACDVTPTECVLRHWQFVYNRSNCQNVGDIKSLPTTSGSRSPTVPDCNLPSLLDILDHIGRHDLVVKLSDYASA